MLYLEILIAGVGAFLLGFGWYTFMFGKAWMQETGMTEEDAQGNMLVTHGLSFLMMCVIAYGISYVVHMHEPAEQNFMHGGFHGLMIAAIYCLPIIAIHYTYQRKSMKLYAIDAGYALVFCGLMGGILGALNLA